MAAVKPLLGRPTALPNSSETVGGLSRAERGGGTVPALALWLMVWAGYNTEIARVLEPTFPTGALDLFHGIRCFFPILAGFVAGIIMLRRGSFSREALEGPMGLLVLYTVCGVISSVLVSTDPLTALYWACEYGSVLIVLWAILSDANPVASVSHLLTVNFAMVTGVTISLFTAIGFLEELVLVPTEGSPVGVKAYGGEFIVSGQMLGMTGTRNTGFGRFAALMVIICLARLWEKKKRSKWLWVFLPTALFALVLCQARTATLALLAGALVILWVKRGSKIMLWAGGIVTVVLLQLIGFYSAFWNYLMRGQPFDPTLTGRTAVWQEGWELFKQSPLLGFGFRGDRIFLEGMDVHNALLQALIHSGVLGGLALVLAFIATWVLALRLYKGRALRELPFLPLEVPGLLAFVTVASITEPTFDLYSVPWLMVAPCLAYLQVITRKREALRAGSRLKRSPKVPLRRSDLGVRPALPQRA